MSFQPLLDPGSHPPSHRLSIDGQEQDHYAAPQLEGKHAHNLQAHHQADVVRARFKMTIGEIPFKEPNVVNDADLSNIVTIRYPVDGCESCCDTVCTCACCFVPIIGCCYLWRSNLLVQEGEYGICMNNGKPEVMMAGRHFLLSPLIEIKGTYSKKMDYINVPPLSFVRVQAGQVGLAWHNAEPEILLPGLHVRNNAAFKFERSISIDTELLQFGPIKFLTVRSGGVRVCFANGKVQIFTEGRYAINSATFVIADQINTQQTNIRFEKHPVLLDGGINMLVEGLLTYQVIDVERLIHELGDANLERTIKDVTKAELARVFAGLHLEQISQSATLGADNKSDKKKIPPQLATHELNLDHTNEPQSFLGSHQATQNEPTSAEGETRMWVCNQVVRAIAPLCSAWGVKIKNFQLESTSIADAKYAAEYEAASLAMAKAAADLRAVHAQNKIVLASATAKAEALRIEAEGKKMASVIEAEGVAEARRIDALARNEAAKVMREPFAQDFAMQGQEVEFAKALKANVLTVVPDSAVGNAVLSQSMLSSTK